MTLIKDREAELREMTSVGGTGDFERLMEELNVYLEDAGERQKENVETLETISRLIGHRFTSGNRTGIQYSHKPIQTEKADLPGESEGGDSRDSEEKAETEAKTAKGKVVLSTETQTEGRTGICAFATMKLEVQGRRLDREVAHRSVQVLEAASPVTESPKPLNQDRFPHIFTTPTPACTDQSTQTDLPDSLAVPTLSAISPPVPTIHSPNPAFRSPPRPNPLLQALEKLAKRQPAMPLKPLFHLLESALDEKNRSDSQDLEANHTPRSMTEFMLDFMYMHYGLKSLTLKSLSALINALEGLARTGQTYGVLFCRLFDVYTDTPIEDSLAAYLMKARSGFEAVLLRYDKQYFKRDYAVGGSVPLSEVADLLYDLFSPQRAAGERVLARLLPASWSLSEAASVLLCSKLARANRDLRQFYLDIDTEKTGSIHYSSFERGLQEASGTLISKAQAQALWQTLGKGVESLGIQQVARVPVKETAQKAVEIKVNKCDFLLAIVEVYEEERDLERNRLKDWFERFDPSQQGVLSLPHFTELISTLNPTLSDEKAASIFREALDFCPESSNLDLLSAPAFCHIALKHRLGQSALLAFFDCGLKDLTERLTDRFVRYEHDLGDMAVATNKFRTPRPR